MLSWQRLVLHPAATHRAMRGLRRTIRIRLRLAPGTTMDCLVSSGPVDMHTVAVLARLQLTARRAGGRLRLVDVSTELAELLALSGLAEVAGLGVEVVGEPEQREEPGGVQEEGDAADPVA